MWKACFEGRAIIAQYSFHIIYISSADISVDNIKYQKNELCKQLTKKNLRSLEQKQLKAVMLKNIQRLFYHSKTTRDRFLQPLERVLILSVRVLLVFHQHPLLFLEYCTFPFAC